MLDKDCAGCKEMHASPGIDLSESLYQFTNPEATSIPGKLLSFLTWPVCVLCK